MFLSVASACASADALISTSLALPRFTWPGAGPLRLMPYSELRLDSELTPTEGNPRQADLSLLFGVSGAKSSNVRGLHLGALASVAEVVATPKARAAWAARGAVACEMEAGGLRRAAKDRPFYALKVVSDAAGGDPSERLQPGDPVQILRFKALALNLVEGRLAPALVSWVGSL